MPPGTAGRVGPQNRITVIVARRDRSRTGTTGRRTRTDGAGLADAARHTAGADQSIARSLIAEKSTSFLSHPDSLRLPVASFSSWSGQARHIMASESFG